MEDVAALQTTAGGVLETGRLSPTEAAKQWLLFNGFFEFSFFFFGKYRTKHEILKGFSGGLYN